MIYRIIGENERWVHSEETDTWQRAQGELRGAFFAGLGWDAWGDLKAPAVSNSRVRFWFTERGWRDYGRHIVASARRSGRPYRLIRRKNPPRSAVVYRDKWQVALLPPRGKP